MSDDFGFMRWQSASNPQTARDLWQEAIDRLATEPHRVLDGLVDKRRGEALVIRRVENEQVVDTRTVVLTRDSLVADASGGLAQTVDSAERMSLTDVAECALFQVFAPRRVPDGWSLNAWFRPTPGMVVLDYRADGETVVCIVQTSAGVHARFATPIDPTSWEEIELGGAPARARSKGRGREHCELEATRSGTDIKMISAALTSEQMVTLALDLRPL